MIHRVSSALVQFLSPIRTIATQSTGETQVQSWNDAKAFKKRHEHPSRESPPEGEHHSKELPQEGGREGLLAQQPQASSYFFHYFFESLKSKQVHLMRWLGWTTYSMILGECRKTGTFRKGAMLDKKVE